MAFGDLPALLVGCSPQGDALSSRLGDRQNPRRKLYSIPPSGQYSLRNEPNVRAGTRFESRINCRSGTTIAPGFPRQIFHQMRGGFSIGAENEFNPRPAFIRL